jgi:hypothetical protein
MKLLFLILTISTTTIYAQNDEAAVKQTINNLFQGMKNSDTALIRSAFSTSAVLQTINKNREGKISVTPELLDSFLVSIAKPHNEVYDERISFETIKIDAELAIVWAPYQFYLGDQFSHCGTDSFQLVKIDGQWKIQYLIDTRRRLGCK